MKNIVLTGGPCGGKSSSIVEVKESLEKRGYKVYILDESATRLIHKGLIPFGENANISMYNFQKVIMLYQIYREELLKSKARLHKNSVILYDRGTIDNKTYLNPEDWQKLLKELHLNEEKLLNRYDLVCHLVSLADDRKDLYEEEKTNNDARSETVEEASERDYLTLSNWSKHPNFKIFDNSTSFQEKKDRVKKSIFTYLGEKDCPTKQYRYLVDIEDTNLKDIKNISKKSYITQDYLVTNNQDERRIRKVTTNGENFYYITEKFKNSAGEKIRKSRKLSKLEYEYLLREKDYSYRTIEKTRYTFEKDKLIYTLDLFDNSDLAILEVESDKKVKLPEDISVIERLHVNNKDIAKKKQLSLSI